MNSCCAEALLRSLLAATLLMCVLGLVGCEKARQDQSRSARLAWGVVTVDTGGKPLKELAGYKIYYGTSAAALTQTVVLSDPHATSYVITNLAPGTWYFAVAAYTSTGSESRLSNVAQKKIN